MKPENWAENAKLDPTGVKLGIFNPLTVTTDVVAPPAVGNICGCRGHLRLKCQAFPGDNGIPRKADWVAMPAQAWPAGEDKGTFLFFAAEVKVVQVVEPE